MTEKDCIINIGSNLSSTKLAKKWANKVTEDLKNMEATLSRESESWKKHCIYKVPTTNGKNNAYIPQMVSIGPYHHGKSQLQPMERHKNQVLLRFLKRSEKPLQRYMDEFAQVVQDLIDAYDQLDAKWRDDAGAFLELMIVDGCFVLELLRLANGTDEHANDDPVFGRHGKLNILPGLWCDMLMLENQLPLMVLAILVAVEMDCSLQEGEEKVTELILKYFTPNEEKMNPSGNLHILDVYRKSLLLPLQKKPLISSNQKEEKINRSATEIHEAGIQIKRSKTNSLEDIWFRGGVLKLPLTLVDDDFEPVYLNLLAFERFHAGVGHEVSSYICFMDDLINEARDVSLLHSCGIIHNALGSDEAAAGLFNSLAKHIMLDPSSSLNYVQIEVDRYCERQWHKWRANLKHTYFTNPWASISVVVAAYVVILTTIQTVYSFLSYYKQNG